MTLRLAPPYVDEPRAKVKSPGWYRLPSTAWLGAEILLTGLVVTVLIMDLALSWVLLLVGLVITASALVTAIVEISRHRKPVASVTNLILSLVLNPYLVVGYLVSLGVLDFG